MNTRQAKLLAAIIDQFIETALPVGSKRLLEMGDFSVSSATIRSEMGHLEEEGYLIQPHVSAGRIPTAKGYRVYVKNFMEPNSQELMVRRKFDTLKEQYFQRKDQERVYEAVAMLSHMVPNVAFATVPHKDRVYYLGLANTLRQPEFQQDPMLASGVVEVLERRLTELLEHIELTDEVRYYIGDEHVLPQIQSCSLMLTSYRVRDERGAIGIIGPMRMDYAYNTTALELIVDLLRSA
jgi:transcriptional regulator of heat shock response